MAGSTMTPYIVNLEISEHEEQFSARLSAEKSGWTPGEWQARLADCPIQSGNEKITLGDLVKKMTKGEIAWIDFSPEEVGELLFQKLLGEGANRDKWEQAVLKAKGLGRPIQLRIKTVGKASRNLPYGLLRHPAPDDTDAAEAAYDLFRSSGKRPKTSLVRSVPFKPRHLTFYEKEGPLRILLAVANPINNRITKKTEGASLLVSSLVQQISSSSNMEVCICSSESDEGFVRTGASWQPESFEPFCYTTPTGLKTALQNDRFDMLHVIAHGTVDHLLLCKEDKTGTWISSEELGELFGTQAQNPNTIQLAFLQVCGASSVDEAKGGFDGLAQQLLNPERANLAVVVASPYPVEIKKSTSVAKHFYDRIAIRKSPDIALAESLEESEKRGELEKTDCLWAFFELWARDEALQDVRIPYQGPYRGLERFEEEHADIFLWAREKCARYPR